MTKGKDLIPGEHDAKSWFNIMAIKNRYFWLTLLGLTGLVFQIINIQWCVEIVLSSILDGAFAFLLTLGGMLIPLVIFLSCGIFLITFWNELKGKK